MRHFELSQDETEILGALVIIFSDASMLRLLMVAWADFSVRMPTVDFICDLLTDTPNKKEIIKQMLSKDGKLRRMRLVLGIDTETFPTHTLQAYTRLIVEQPVLDAWFDRMSDHAPLPYVLHHQHGVPKQSLIVDSTILEELEYVLSSPHPHLCLVGQPHSGRRTICISIALQQYQKSILEIDICRAFLGVSLTEMESCLSIIMREALLAGGMLMLRCDRLADDQALISRLKECQSQLARIVSQFPGEIILLATHEDAILDDIFGKLNYIHISPPDQKASKEIWKRALSPWSDFSEIEQMSDIFSKNYQIPIGNINNIVSQAVLSIKQKQSDDSLSMHHILSEIHKSFDHQLGTLAEVVVSDVKLSGVVLPVEARKKVDEILEYATNLDQVLTHWGFRKRSPYGNSLSVLFSGPPGTGKTLLAGALANELGKVLYRVDLSRIVDKYIGKTTAVPQLFRIAQAEDSQWIPSSLVRDNRREFRLRTN